MKPISLISSDLFNVIRSRFTNLEMGDENGMVTLDSNSARFFDFDFEVERKNLGRVSISLNEPGNLKIFYSQGILEGTDSTIQEKWFNFLRKMRKFAKRRLLRFDTRDITKSHLKQEDFKFLANKNNKENTMNESTVYGSSLSSFLPLQKTLLIIRHKKPVGLTRGDRSRQIKSIFVQNDEGERFKMPINDLRTARAMQRHCANGGRPYDKFGTIIIQMGSECSQLRDFKRRCKMDSMQEATHQVIQAAYDKFESLKEQLETICSQRGYENFKLDAENRNVDEVLIDESTLQQYREKFSQTVFREDLSQYFPLLEKIMREAGEIDLTTLTNEKKDEDEVPAKPLEIEEYEKWADEIESSVGNDLSSDEIKKIIEMFKEDPSITRGIEDTGGIQIIKDKLGEDFIDNHPMLKKLLSNASSDDELIEIFRLSFGEELSKELEDVSDENESDEDESDTEEPPEEPAASLPAEPSASPPAEPPVATPPAEPSANPPQPTAEGKTPSKKRIKKISALVKSFYNAEATDQNVGPWTIGETAVLKKVEKKFGKAARKVAKRIIKKLTRRHTIKQEQAQAEAMFEDMLRLSGIKK